MEDKIIRAPLTSEEPATLRAMANMSEPDKDKVSKIIGVPYEEVTEEQRAEAKKALFDYAYCRTDNYPFKDCLITAKLLEPKDSDNSLKNLYNKFIRNSEVN